MSDYDISIDDQIDALHSEAEELHGRAKLAQHEESAESLRREATRKVKQAARLRAQAGEEL
jgi:hypothetical protein